jgi:hypothetical protein
MIPVAEKVYKLAHALLVVEIQSGKLVWLPVGARVVVPKPDTDSGLTVVRWEGRACSAFIEDLVERSEV